MNQIQKTYRKDLDVLKAISIIAVVFYHIGLLDTGYLGVDVFFAINGFLVIPSIIGQLADDNFSYFEFLLKRTMRLWPMVLIAGAVSLLIGVLGMLPDDYENLAQSVFASNMMAQNILSAITTRDYWDVSNEYKPLMHFWYLGILMSLYVCLPLIFMAVRLIVRKVSANFVSVSKVVLVLLALFSFCLYLNPRISEGDKFYYLPCRLWELIAGGLVGMTLPIRHEKSTTTAWGYVAFISVSLLLCSSLFLPYSTGAISSVTGAVQRHLMLPANILLMSVVAFTCVLLYNPVKVYETVWSRAFTFLGQISFSIFVWHQVILAFYRYFYGQNTSLLFVVILWLFTILVSIVAYRLIEQKIRPSEKNFVKCGILMSLISLLAFYLYLNAGVVRDVPELNVYVGKTHRGQFAEYCDRVYAYDREFPDNEKINVLVEGISFGRDFANILLESEYKDKINLSYIFLHDEIYEERYKQCDFLFTFRKKSDVPNYVWASLKDDVQVFGIGTKNFGENNGFIYKNRNEIGYYDQTIKINPNFFIVNEEWKMSWEGNYVDLLELSSAGDGHVRVFTDTNQYISQDCRHLTSFGAQWFAKIIKWANIFKSK